MKFKAFSLVLIALFLISCSKETDFKEYEVIEPTVTPNEIQQEIIQNNWREPEKYKEELGKLNHKYDDCVFPKSPEERLTLFLDSLCSGNIELVDVLTNGWGHEEYKDVQMEYEILSKDVSEPYGECTASVLINVTESNCDTFPVGEHTYTLTSRYLPDTSFIFMVRDGNDLSDNIPETTDEKFHDARLFGDRYLDFCFYPDLGTPDYDKLFSLMELDLYEKFMVKYDGFTIEELRQHMKERFGGNEESYPELEERFASRYNEEVGKYQYPYGQCKTTYAKRISEVEKTENGYKITYEYFSDMSYLQKCMEITLTFEANGYNDVMMLTAIERNIVTDVPIKTYNP